MKKSVIIMALSVFFISGILAESTENKWLKYADSMYKKKKYSEAIDAYEKVLKINPSNTAALRNEGYCYAAKGDYAKAVELLNKYLGRKKDPAVARYVKSLNKKAGPGPGPVAITGGSTRLAALGGPVIALPDSAAMMDLYSEGYGSAYMSRPKKNLLDLGVMAVLSGQKRVRDNATENTTEINGFGLTQNYREKDTGYAAWLSDSDVLVVKPCLGVELGGIKYSDNTGASSEESLSGSLLSAKVQYSREALKDLSVGALFGVARYASDQTDNGDPKTQIGMYYFKLDYQLSADYRFDVAGIGMAAGLSAGKCTPNVVQNLLLIQSLNPFQNYQAMFNNLYSEEAFDLAESAVFKDESHAFTDVGAFDISVGLSAAKKDIFEALLNIRLVAGMQGIYHGTATLTDKTTGNETTFDYPGYNRINAGFESMITLKGRYYLDMFIFGLSCKFMNFNVDMLLSPSSLIEKMIVGIFDFAAGSTIKIGNKFLVPVEFYMQGGSHSDGTTTDVTLDVKGIRAGAEYAMEPDRLIRAGLDFTSGGVVVTGGFFSGDPIGTVNNPATNVLGINAGYGMKWKDTSLDLGLRWEILYEAPLPAVPFYKEDSNMRFFLTAGLKTVM